MKKITISGAIFCFLFQVVAVFAATPDYSGVWELDAGRLTLPNTMPIGEMTLKVWQTDKELRIESAVKSSQSSARSALQAAVYSLDGQEMTSDAGSGTMARKEIRKASLTAEGKLNLTVTRDFTNGANKSTIKINEIWEMMDAGKTLKITRYTETSRGAANAEMYFTKTSSAPGDKTVTENPKVVLDPNLPSIPAGEMLSKRAVKLVKPDYPAAARATRARGAVTVKATVDENGDVISAEAVSGDPLLWQAAEKAAKKSKFSPNIVDGKAVQITGVIVYNFVP
jgi:TonB family protein